MPTAVRLSQRAGDATGQPISYLMHEALKRPELISLAAGFVDQLTLPIEPVRQAIDEVLSEQAAGQVALQYGHTAGDFELREQLLDRLTTADGGTPAGLSVKQVVITAGSNQLLHLIAETLLDPGDIVLCAAPGYFVFLGALNGMGARTIGVAIDDEGIIPSALEEALERCDRSGELARVKAVYLTSYYDNPSGTTLPLDRRRQIVEIVKRYSRAGRIWVIDDAAYRELRYEGKDTPSLLSCDETHETVIHTGSFSKSFSPGVRVGWGVLPAALVEPVLSLKGNIDFGSPNLNQRLMANVLRLGLLDPHIAKLRASYREKLAAMLSAMDKHLKGLAGAYWVRPRGGLYVWLTLDPTVPTGAQSPLFAAALEEGVLYVPGEFCYPREGVPVGYNTLRLSFGVQPPGRIAEGIEALGRAIRRAQAAT